MPQPRLLSGAAAWLLLGGLIFGLAVLAGITMFAGEHAMAQKLPGYDRVAGARHASRSEVIAPHGMAATSQPLATQIALDVLGGTDIYHSYDGDNLLQLLADLFQDAIVTDNDEGHTRQIGVLGFANCQRVDVVAAR